MDIFENIGKLGFGLMRLPRKDGAIDVEQTKDMVDMFMDAGFTYFDTAWAYEGSEDAIRQALVERYPRESFQLASKNAAWIGCENREQAIAQFDTTLRQTGAGYIDFYLLHNLGEHRTKVFEDMQMWDFVKELKASGRIRHYGFSFHGTADELDAILTEHPDTEFVLLQINYADWESPSIQSRRCYEVACRHGKPIIVMEPVKGGLLANPPERVASILKEAEPEKSVASWALRFAADLEGVRVVLSGMSDIGQMEDNLASMRDFKGLTGTERETLAKAVEELRSIDIIPCTTCDYCAKVCPENIGISGSFTVMNELTLFGNKTASLTQMGWLVGAHGRQTADKCIKCGECEKACPQHIRIVDELDRVVESFELGKE